MKAIHQYPERTIRTIILAWLFMCILVGFELASYYGQTQILMRNSRTRIRPRSSRRYEADDEEEDDDFVTLESK